VKNNGCATCGQTADQLQYSRFWSDIANTQLPPGHWLAILDTVATAKGLDTLETARLTAKLGTAVADASIKVWNVKYLEGDLTWRPETAIRECTIATCGVAGDPTWQSLWAAPPFPGYISGHSGFSAAAATILANYFGDNTAFCSQSDPNAGFPSIVTRCFTSFSQAAAEAGDSRIIGGIHFSFDNTAGLAVGQQIGNFDYANAFNSVPEPASLLILVSGVMALGFGRRRVAVSAAA
jgi:membrane-associated phospholipid phosphatase